MKTSSIHESREEQRELATAFLELGRARGERAVRFSPAAEARPEEFLEFLTREEAAALAEGRAGLCVAADMECFGSTEVMFELEARINALLEGRRITLLCQYQKERFDDVGRGLIEVQEKERRHLALELHDEVGQLLTGLRLLLKTNPTMGLEVVKARLEQARALVDRLLERVRGLSFDLRPAALDQLGLVPALAALFERYTDQTGVLINFKHREVDERIAPEVATTAFRIVQEALTNVARHAGVAGAHVRVWTARDVLNVQIEDRGRGFDPEAIWESPRSTGLAGMRERARLAGGTLSIDAQPSQGTQITLELPMKGRFEREGQ